MAKQVVGVFDSQHEAVEAIRGLTSQGYDNDQITVITNRRDNDMLENRTGTTVDSGTGAGTGTDHNGDSFWDKVKDYFTMDDDTTGRSRLSSLGLSESDESRYASQLDDGKYIVAVDGSGSSAAAGTAYDSGTDATLTGTPGVSGTDLNSGTGVYNDGTGTAYEYDNDRDSTLTGTPGAGLDRGADTFSSTGGFDSTAGTRDTNTTAGANYVRDNETDEERTLRLREERLNVDKREVKTGEVEVNKEVYEERADVDVPVKHEEVYVERRSVNEAADAADFDTAAENETIRVPIVEEQIEVTKKPVVTDEIVIGKKKVEETEHVSETVRKEDATLDTKGDTTVDGDSTLGSKRNDKF
ncbi:YsnF/AvaK domain-containing protein [Peribacillus sp. SCS-26]|uniref:YsnF/AvaK domain-containing protein n=1 Tax=Paraperibacillus marinus TaxID=3115295 RepID=UPI003906B642